MPDGTFSMLKPLNQGEPEWGKGETAPKLGAYYYVYGGLVKTYKSASATIILPTGSNISLKGTGPGRNGYICFGVTSIGQTGIDIGLQNMGPEGGGGDKGLGWRPVCYKVFTKKLQSGGVAPSTAKQARITITPNLTSTNKIRLTVEWLDGAGNVINQNLNFNQEFGLAQIYNWNKFYRFASLPSNDGAATRTDSTFMLTGEFVNAKVGSANWGIGTGTVEKAWIYSHPKCQLPDNYWDTGEQFRIDHWA